MQFNMSCLLKEVVWFMKKGETRSNDAWLWWVGIAGTKTVFSRHIWAWNLSKAGDFVPTHTAHESQLSFDQISKGWQNEKKSAQSIQKYICSLYLYRDLDYCLCHFFQHTHHPAYYFKHYRSSRFRCCCFFYRQGKGADWAAVTQHSSREASKCHSSDILVLPTRCATRFFFTCSIQRIVVS